MFGLNEDRLEKLQRRIIERGFPLVKIISNKKSEKLYLSLFVQDKG